jgi:hypothetical protein
MLSPSPQPYLSPPDINPYPLLFLSRIPPAYRNSWCFSHLHILSRCDIRAPVVAVRGAQLAHVLHLDQTSTHSPVQVSPVDTQHPAPGLLTQLVGSWDAAICRCGGMEGSGLGRTKDVDGMRRIRCGIEGRVRTAAAEMMPLGRRTRIMKRPSGATPHRRATSCREWCAGWVRLWHPEELPTRGERGGGGTVVHARCREQAHAGVNGACSMSRCHTRSLLGCRAGSHRWPCGGGTARRT